jgi:hypothetical protein
LVLLARATQQTNHHRHRQDPLAIPHDRKPFGGAERESTDSAAAQIMSVVGNKWETRKDDWEVERERKRETHTTWTRK